MAAVPPLRLLGEWTWETTTQDGADITVRPMQPDDVEREREFFESRKLGFAVTFDAAAHVMHISRDLPATAV